MKKTARSLSHEDVIDIVLYGSVLEGKSFPNDIDIAVLTTDPLSYEEKKEIRNAFEEADLEFLTLEEMMTTAIGQEVFLKGKSLITETFLTERFNLLPRVLFTYTLSGMEQAEKVKATRALYGQNSKGGMVKELDGTKIARGVLLLPLETSREMTEVLIRNNIKYKKIPVLLPQDQAETFVTRDFLDPREMDSSTLR